MKTRGFTLIELLLSVTLIGAIVGIASPVYIGVVKRNDLDLATTTIVQSMRRAQSLARGSYGDSAWGVYVGSGHIVLFKGSTYLSRSSEYDENFILPASITPSGIGEVVFTKITGIPQSTGNQILTSNYLNETRTITINSKGMVTF